MAKLVESIKYMDTNYFTFILFFFHRLFYAAAQNTRPDIKPLSVGWRVEEGEEDKSNASEKIIVNQFNFQTKAV